MSTGSILGTEKRILRSKTVNTSYWKSHLPPYKKDVRTFNLFADDYLQKTGIEPKLMIVGIYVSLSVMREILDSPKKIEFFSDDDEEEFERSPDYIL